MTFRISGFYEKFSLVTLFSCSYVMMLYPSLSFYQSFCFQYTSNLGLLWEDTTEYCSGEGWVWSKPCSRSGHPAERLTHEEGHALCLYSFCHTLEVQTGIGNAVVNKEQINSHLINSLKKCMKKINQSNFQGNADWVPVKQSYIKDSKSNLS